MAFKSTLFEFWNQKEIELGRRLSVLGVAGEAGISRAAIQRLLDGDMQRIDVDTVDALCRFFAVQPGPVPFLQYVPDAPEQQ